MKTKFLFKWIVIIFVALGLTVCGDALMDYKPGEEAFMTALRIGVVEIPIPEGMGWIEDYEWDDLDFNLLTAPNETAPLQRNSDTEQVRFWPSVSKGARVSWGIGTDDMRPFTFHDLRIPATFNDADWIYFRVTSEDGEAVNYYRFYAWVRSPVNEIADITIGDYDYDDRVPNPNFPDNSNNEFLTETYLDDRMFANFQKDSKGNVIASPTLAAAVGTVGGSISIRINQAQAAKLIVERYDEKATIRVGKVTGASNMPQLVNVGEHSSKLPFTGFNFTDQEYLYIEVTAENEVDVVYFKLRVDVGRVSTLKGLSFLVDDGGDPDEWASYPVVSLGTLHALWGNVQRGNFDTAEMPATGFNVRIITDDPNATATYALVSNPGTTRPTDNDFNNPQKVIFNGNNFLGIKVVSENTLSTRFYKLDVTLLAAAFAKQPRSDYYYYYNDQTIVGNAGDQVSWYDYAAKTGVKENADGGNHANFAGAKGIKGSSDESKVELLTFELDRTGNFEYQWYEANSWYGGYGFDSEGRILYYSGTNPNAIRETGFSGGDANDSSTYFVAGFDEKKNVSLHNGGNQFYRLPYMGTKVAGASGTTTNGGISAGFNPYRPGRENSLIWYRPFIDGFTSVTHYYWVEITDVATGRKAVSKRAAIIWERDPTKRHHIVNLNEDLWEMDGTQKVIYPARNANVFTYQREAYYIPFNLPNCTLDNKPFDHNDYTVATVQALFFLRDGRPWIQNWTQGDIGFTQPDGDLIYYNLTNNNGTLGLVGGGKEPGGGSLTGTPTHIVVKPAGEKPIREFPPFEENADGTPKLDQWGRQIPANNNNAQGWFTGFIELVEVHFEGPAR